MDRVQLPTELALNMSEYIALLRQYYMAYIYLPSKRALKLSSRVPLHCTEMHRVDPWMAMAIVYSFNMFIS